MEEDKTLQQQDGAGVALPAADAGAEARAAALQTLSQISYSESLTHKQVRQAINSNSTKANANFEGLDAEIQDAAPYNEVEIDLTGMDEGTWYPVVIDVQSGLSARGAGNHCTVARFKVSARLGDSGVPIWCTHDRGFAVELIWTDGQAIWGVFSPTRTVEYYDERWTNEPCVGGLNRVVERSFEYFYARGGGKYAVRVEGLPAPINWYAEETVIGANTVAPVTTAPARPVWDAKLYSNTLGKWFHVGDWTKAGNFGQFMWQSKLPVNAGVDIGDMLRIELKGYAYGLSTAVDIVLVCYLLNGDISGTGWMNHGSNYVDEVKVFANASGNLGIYVRLKNDVYFQNWQVMGTCYSNEKDPALFSGWTFNYGTLASAEIVPTTATNVATVPCRYTSDNDVVEFPYLEGSVDEPVEVSQATLTALNGYIERHGIVLYYKEGDRKIFRIPIEGSELGYFGLLEFYVGSDGAGYFMASWDIEGSIKRAFGMFGYDATGKITQMAIGENSTYLLLTEEEKAKYEEAATDASTADAKATTAQNTANEANSKATNAQTAAQTAVSQSATAKSAADAAAAAAADALAAVDGFVKNVLTFGEVTSGTYSPGSGELSFTSVKAQAGDTVTFCAIINNGGSTRGGGTFLLKRGNTRYINWKKGAGIGPSTDYNAVTADVTASTFTTRAGIVQNRVFVSTKTAQIVVCDSTSSDGYRIK